MLYCVGPKDVAAQHRHSGGLVCDEQLRGRVKGSRPQVRLIDQLEAVVLGVVQCCAAYKADTWIAT